MEFVKFESTGNDFILVNNLCGAYGDISPETIQKICDRHLGIGADGLIFLEPPPSPKFQFLMRYFNSDGEEVEMCGNGARALTYFAHRYVNIPLVLDRYLFKTYQSQCQASFREEKNRVTVSVEMPPITQIHEKGGQYTWEHGHSFDVHTGVPHLCLETPQLENWDVRKWGQHYRNLSVFENGTNVNFFRIANECSAFVRTYERGVEGETLSCGTGAVAVAQTLKALHHHPGPFELTFPGGVLTVDLSQKLPILIGPTKAVFEGNISL